MGLLAASAPLRSASSAPSASSSQSQPTFRTGTRLIVQTVTVKDRDGRPIEGLTAKDFVVTEDDEPQTIAFVEYQRVESPRSTGGCRAARRRRPPIRSANRPRRLRRRKGSMRATAIAGWSFCISIRRRCRRGDLMRAFSGARSYIASQMQPQDLMAIMTFEGGAVRIRQEFTADRARLNEVILRIIAGNDLDGDGIPDTTDDIGSAFGQDDARVQHPQYRSPALGAADGRRHAAAVPRAEVAGLLCQRPAVERHRQPGAAPRDDQRGHPRQRVDLPGRRARSGRGGAARRRVASIARRHRHAHRTARRDADGRLPAFAGHALRVWQRIPAAARSSTTTTCRSASPRRPRRSPATTSSATTARTRRSTGSSAASGSRSPAGCRANWRTARDTSPTRSSPSTPPPTRNASSKRRSCSRTRSPRSPSRWR